MRAMSRRGPLQPGGFFCPFFCLAQLGRDKVQLTPSCRFPRRLLPQHEEAGRRAEALAARDAGFASGLPPAWLLPCFPLQPRALCDHPSSHPPIPNARSRPTCPGGCWGGRPWPTPGLGLRGSMPPFLARRPAAEKEPLSPSLGSRAPWNSPAVADEAGAGLAS